MFPMRGSFHGPGGSFGAEFLALDLFTFFHYNKHKEVEGKEERQRGKLKLHEAKEEEC